jgi:uncharacterized protein YndB with AHSA1/START domain
MSTTANQHSSDTAPTTNRELRITRILNAPIDLVWEVWTTPDHIKNWWGPNGFTNTIRTMDVRPGGEWEFTMHGPDGTDYRNQSIFREVIRPARLVYEHLTGPHFIATISFTAEGDKTHLDWHMLFDSAEEFDRTVKVFKADEGLKQNIVRLEDYVAASLSGKPLSH